MALEEISLKVISLEDISLEEIFPKEICLKGISLLMHLHFAINLNSGRVALHFMVA